MSDYTDNLPNMNMDRTLTRYTFHGSMGFSRGGHVIKRSPSLIRRFIVICTAIFMVVLLAFASQIYAAREIILERTGKALSAEHLQASESLTSFKEAVENVAFALCYSPTIQKLLQTSSDIDRVLMSDDINSIFPALRSCRTIYWVLAFLIGTATASQVTARWYPWPA